jgi:hypothetical protein
VFFLLFLLDDSMVGTHYLNQLREDGTVRFLNRGFYVFLAIFFFFRAVWQILGRPEQSSLPEAEQASGVIQGWRLPRARG